MGQQQLLLVSLVTIIVGIVTVVAINTFSSASELVDVRQDVGNIAASAHIYFMKPEILGGGEQDFSKMTFRNITFASDTISGDAYIAGNQNGTYRLLNLTETSVDIEAYPSSLEGYVHGSGAGSQKLTATVTRDNLEWTSNIPID